MKLDESHPLNELVIRHCVNRKAGAQPLASPDSHPAPYLRLGSHPDVVERVWDGLGSTLPVDCRAIVYGTPALVHPVTGIVFAMAYGTAYAIRISCNRINAALEAGCRREQSWAGGSKTNIEAEFGQGWLFGSWLKEESQWLLDMYKQLEQAT